MEIRNDKDIAKFFNKYSEELLPDPDDSTEFIKEFKENLSRLPEPSEFQKSDLESIRKHNEHLIMKLKERYKFRKKNAIITSIFACLIALIMMTSLYSVGLLSINIIITILSSVAFIFTLGSFIYDMTRC